MSKSLSICFFKVSLEYPACPSLVSFRSWIPIRHIYTLITFQQWRWPPYIEQQKDKLLTIIVPIIGSDQTLNILQDSDKGIYFSGAHHKKKGIRVHHSPDHLAFLQHANEILTRNCTREHHLHSIHQFQPAKYYHNYNNLPDCYVCDRNSVADNWASGQRSKSCSTSNGPTSPSIESQTCKISDKIAALMNHVNIPTHTKRRNGSTILNVPPVDAEHTLHSASSDLEMGDMDF